MATLLTFRPLNRASFRRLNPQDSVLRGHHGPGLIRAHRGRGVSLGPQESAAILAQIQQIVRPNVEALGLESLENEGAHRHVGVIGETG